MKSLHYSNAMVIQPVPASNQFIDALASSVVFSFCELKTVLKCEFLKKDTFVVKKDVLAVLFVHQVHTLSARP